MASAYASKSQRLKDNNYGARYIFCVYMDENTSKNMVSEVKEGKRRHPYFTLVYSLWGEPIPEDEQDPDDPQDFRGQDDEG
ncbi:hypothetical protein GLAREA_06163 [Glarea lozoyensis ATCC 20868]|uniref:Uncharacterized protein n=1 Tax=Glarea lozoyensis (strain ATCC 20868 / MF5171) TaxID=1116229 RepID=S3DM52_GLAL2|nr:uncharacterized protein GLAREA_06163 [Glarea lozoyensis ATCC 20868]EPE33151.1 hypothetical protein GLAREA_06163 [Glarea lozoyensis ATCC 20868]